MLSCASLSRRQMCFLNLQSKVQTNSVIYMSKSITCRHLIWRRHTEISGSSPRKDSHMWVSLWRIGFLKSWSLSSQRKSYKNLTNKLQCCSRRWKQTPKTNSKSTTLTWIACLHFTLSSTRSIGLLNSLNMRNSTTTSALKPVKSLASRAFRGKARTCKLRKEVSNPSLHGRVQSRQAVWSFMQCWAVTILMK